MEPLGVPFDFRMVDLVDKKKNGDKPISCACNWCQRVSDVFEASVERNKFIHIGGKFEGKLVEKIGLDRGGGATRVGKINCNRTDANSCKEYDPFGTFWDAPDNYENVSKIIFEPLEPQLVETKAKTDAMVQSSKRSKTPKRRKTAPATLGN
jgi:hypothetical protein